MVGHVAQATCGREPPAPGNLTAAGQRRDPGIDDRLEARLRAHGNARVLVAFVAVEGVQRGGRAVGVEGHDSPVHDGPVRA